MPAEIIVVHELGKLVADLTTRVTAAGYKVATFSDPIEAINRAQTVKLLVTALEFPAGKPNGSALARMARIRQNTLKFLFLAPPELTKHADDIGECIELPTHADAVFDSIDRLLQQNATRN